MTIYKILLALTLAALAWSVLFAIQARGDE